MFSTSEKYYCYIRSEPEREENGKWFLMQNSQFERILPFCCIIIIVLLWVKREITKLYNFCCWELSCKVNCRWSKWNKNTTECCPTNAFLLGQLLTAENRIYCAWKWIQYIDWVLNFLFLIFVFQIDNMTTTSTTSIVKRFTSYFF
jgi:hypothetical protein